MPPLCLTPLLRVACCLTLGKQPSCPPCALRHAAPMPPSTHNPPCRTPAACPATVKCVFKAFDKMRTEEEIEAAAKQKGSMVVKMPPGRFRHLRL